MNDELGFVVQPFDGAAVDGYSEVSEVVEDRVLVAMQRLRKVDCGNNLSSDSSRWSRLLTHRRGHGAPR